MNLAVLSIFLGFAVLSEYVLAQPVKYDQRQEGDLNVRTDVEDVVFVVVPPQDLVAAGMGLVAATAADFLRKNYGSIGPERWPMRTTAPKLGFVQLEKSPYKIDLEKSGIKVKKISQPGDPNRYNFHEGKNPSKAVPEVTTPISTEVAEKSTTEMISEMVDEMPTTTESKTVKKVLKPEEIKKMTVTEKKPLEEKKEEKLSSEPVKKSEETKTKTDEKVSKGTQELKKEEELKVITDDGDFSMSRLEGCGPGAYRDNTGKCVYEKIANPK